jgi:hypothetical protein
MPIYRKPNPSGFKLADHIGDLLLILPTVYHEEYQTINGTKPAVEATVVVLTDGTGPPEEEPERVTAVLFGAVLTRQLEGHEGEWFLGRLELGAAKGGKQAPYRLQDPTELDEAIASEYLESVADN